MASMDSEALWRDAIRIIEEFPRRLIILGDSTLPDN
jgi:hypothetical protein